MTEQDTIVAISTPPGNGAIGVIRLSGPRSLAILGGLWVGKVPTEGFEPRRVYVGHIRSLEGGEFLDQVLAFYLKAPSSYTGEDMVEIQAHGGQNLLKQIIYELIHRAGARHADPGEFTKRAFLNGRMDLSQAEAVADVINASTERAALLAERQLEGSLSRYVGKLRNDLKIMRAQLEAMIDFPEDEDVQGLHHPEILERTDALKGSLQGLLETYEEGRLLKEGVRVAIVGKPNVGKSSLFNALLQHDRAIVHATPGTTRDLIEETLNLHGLLVRFIDTAGLRRGEDQIEKEGIRRAAERLQQTDLVLAVFDASRPLDNQDQLVFDAVANRSVFFLRNKSDLPEAFSASKIAARAQGPVFSISALKGTGIDEVKKSIVSHFLKEETKTSPLALQDGLILTNLRHKTALEKGLQALEAVSHSAREKKGLELLVADLSAAMEPLGEITGEVTNDEILGEIFSRFCIGK